MWKRLFTDEGVREEGSKGSESLCYIISREVLNITLFAQYKPKLMPDLIRCQIYERLAVGLKMKRLVRSLDALSS